MKELPAHVSVLLEEVVGHLEPKPGGIYVDATLGLGGHSELLLERSGPDGKVVGFEWDADAAARAATRLSRFSGRFTLVAASYAMLTDELARLGIAQVQGIIADLGVSSLQLDSADRGFSFQADAVLDMRMDRRSGSRAADLVARCSEQELADIIYHYGEERQARRIARCLVEARDREPVETTRQLAEVVAAAVPRKFHPKKIHVATRTFQALRIAVNRELDNLRRLLVDAPKVLEPGGRICIIAFHSLEDRMVKQAFAGNAEYAVVTRKPVEARPEEIAANPRARSARLRVAQRRTSIQQP